MTCPWAPHRHLSPARAHCWSDLSRMGSLSTVVPFPKLANPRRGTRVDSLDVNAVALTRLLLPSRGHTTVFFFVHAARTSRTRSATAARTRRAPRGYKRSAKPRASSRAALRAIPPWTTRPPRRPVLRHGIWRPWRRWRTRPQKVRALRPPPARGAALSSFSGLKRTLTSPTSRGARRPAVLPQVVRHPRPPPA